MTRGATTYKLNTHVSADTSFIQAIATEVVKAITPTLASLRPVTVQPALLNVKDAAIYLGRSEQSVQHLIFDKLIPVVRIGRRVHLHRADLDRFIEQNKY